MPLDVKIRVMDTIKLPRNIVNSILQHAQSEEKLEVCGLISEKNGQPHKVYPVLNIADDPQHLFKMDGKQQIDAMREMRGNDESLYAIYHSHPSSSAYPSITDIEESQYPDAIYIIVSLDTKGVLDLRAFKLHEGEVISLAVTL